ncbi:MAG: hypothetical protein D6693_04345 [Planctomycetota bacterium]|nr:MAG: hypothetical protein D6693_04345 [Planctomycetota bacterium]
MASPALCGGRCCVPAPGVILLAGGLKPAPLAAATGVHPLWLAPDGTTSLLARWVERLNELARACGEDADLEVRVVFDRSRDAAQTPRPIGRARVVFVSESGQYRGPAGVARDVADSFVTSGVTLIAETNRWLGASLIPLIREHAERGAAVTVARQADGSPAGVYLASAEALSLVPAKGFMDLKEQWLAKVIDAGLGVYVHTFAGVGAPAVRTREDLLWVARAHAPAGEPWRVVSSRAEVDPSAVILESVVMPGARVGAGAVVARSVVAPGAAIDAGAACVDGAPAGDPDLAARMPLEAEDAR